MSLERMRKRLQHDGGAAQQDRMIKGRLRSMLSASKYSYQAARFSLYPAFAEEYPGLFNRETLTQDYDTKMISVPFESKFKVGDIFRWENTQTLWIIYSQELSELAYFRGHCRRCNWEVQWVNKDRQVCQTPIAVIGPSTPDLRNITSARRGISFNIPNGNLEILVPDNDQNRAYFDRDQEFLLLGRAYRVDQIDPISMPGVIQIFATEFYVNLIEDDVEENLVNAWNVQPILEDMPTSYGIEGPLTIKPKQLIRYSPITVGGEWSVVEQTPIEFVVVDEKTSEITIKWNSMNSGSFTLVYTMSSGVSYKKQIVVESLF